MSNKYHIVDVFAEKKYSGNQLAVVIMSETITESDMQKIAQEFHFSETTFVDPAPKDNGSYDVRIFTPKEEVPFAGHPTLGTAYIIQSELLKEPAGKIVLNYQIGQIPVTYEKKDDAGILWMKQIEPVFGDIYDPKDIACVAGVSEKDIDERFPVQMVSTGMPVVILPLKDIKSVKKAHTAMNKYSMFFRHRKAMPLFVFSPQAYSKENQINARMFAEVFGIPEDPATGSANGCLAAYLVKYRFFGENKIDIRVEQGYEIGRESILYLRAEEKKASIDVNVGGKVFKIAEGKLF